MTDITTRARALHSVAEARERELLAIWAAVRPGNPAPLTEREVLHAVEDVRRERDALRAEVERMRARRPVLCTRCYGGDGWRHCGACGGAGAVIVEGEK